MTNKKDIVLIIRNNLIFEPVVDDDYPLSLIFHEAIFNCLDIKKDVLSNYLGIDYCFVRCFTIKNKALREKLKDVILELYEYQKSKEAKNLSAFSLIEKSKEKICMEVIKLKSEEKSKKHEKKLLKNLSIKKQEVIKRKKI